MLADDDFFRFIKFRLVKFVNLRLEEDIISCEENIIVNI